MDTPEPQWEAIVTQTTPYTDRLKVPGGWVYRVSSYQSGINLVFIPEPDAKPGENINLVNGLPLRNTREFSW